MDHSTTANAPSLLEHMETNMSYYISFDNIEYELYIRDRGEGKIVSTTTRDRDVLRKSIVTNRFRNIYLYQTKVKK